MLFENKTLSRSVVKFDLLISAQFIVLFNALVRRFCRVHKVPKFRCIFATLHPAMKLLLLVFVLGKNGYLIIVGLLFFSCNGPSR